MPQGEGEGDPLQGRLQAPGCAHLCPAALGTQLPSTGCLSQPAPSASRSQGEKECEGRVQPQPDSSGTFRGHSGFR